MSFIKTSKKISFKVRPELLVNISALPVEHDYLSDENYKRKQKRATLENVVIQESSLNL